jgi:hypothetical protein
MPKFWGGELFAPSGAINVYFCFDGVLLLLYLETLRSQYMVSVMVMRPGLRGDSNTGE